MVRIIIFLILDLTIAAMGFGRRRKKYVTEKDYEKTAHNDVII